MRSIFILFLTEEDRVRGFAALAKRAQISSLPGRVYQVPIDSLPILESEHIDYRRATDAEVKAANDKRRINDPVLGLFADEPELIDEIMESVYLARETHPLRTPGNNPAGI